MGRLLVSLSMVVLLWACGAVSSAVAVAAWIVLWGLLDMWRDTRLEYAVPYGATAVMLVLHWLL